MQSTSKYKLITTKLINSKFDDFKLNEIPSDGQLMSVNGTFIASCWQAAGGCISILNKSNPHRVYCDIPLIRAHMRNINDVRFSPFITNLLSTASDDGTIKLWQVPDEGLTADMTQEVQKYSLHGKKVILTQYHPCSCDIIASISADNSIHVWNICNGKQYFNVSTKDSMSSLDWNYNGSLLGTITKEKLAYIIDPRQGCTVLTANAHEGSKTQKMLFVDPNYFITTGFNKSNARELKLYDIRNCSSSGALMTKHIDNQTGNMYPWYDEETKVICVPSRGEAMIHFYSFDEGTINKLNQNKLATNSKSFTFSEKRFSDYKTNEMSRMYKYKENALELVSIYVPKKGGMYDKSLYPDSFAGISSISGDDWANGGNAEVVRRDFDEVVGGYVGVVSSSSGSSSGMNGSNIVKKESVVVEESLEVQVTKLKKEIERLNKIIEEKDAINDQLRKDNDNLRDLLNKRGDY